jgi:hypothetical protein
MIVNAAAPVPHSRAEARSGACEKYAQPLAGFCQRDTMLVQQANREGSLPTAHLCEFPNRFEGAFERIARAEVRDLGSELMNYAEFSSRDVAMFTEGQSIMTKYITVECL